MSTSESAARAPVLADDRGAVMVMGLFMCSCLVAALWYLAGIGDAIMYRERMQEAADAIAFSDAALHARGMNLLVMLNLIMAVVLAVRVAIRAAKLACTIAAAVFAALSFLNPAYAPAAASAAAAAETLNTADSSSKPEIDGALNGLMSVQDVLAAAIPPLAMLGAESLKDHYADVVTNVTVYRPSHPEPTTAGLPVERGSPDKLCREAAQAIGDLTTWLIGKASAGLLVPVAKVIELMMEALVNTDHQYFCDLEAGASQPSGDSQLDDAAQQKCQNPDDVLNQEATHFQTAEKAWESECAAEHVTCVGFDPKGAPLATGIETGTPTLPAGGQPNTLARLQLERDDAARSQAQLEKAVASHPPDAFQSQAECQAWAKNDMKQQQSDQQGLDQKQGNNDGGKSQGSSGIAPLRVKDFENGNEFGQFIGGVAGNDGMLRKDSTIVRLGAFHSKKAPAQVDPPNAKLPAWAQAEMFFDCAGSWNDKACNGGSDGSGEDAMWRFRWRPRLRRFDLPTDNMLQILAVWLRFTPPARGPEDFANDLAKEAPATANAVTPNKALRVDLAKSIQENNVNTQGVH